MSDKFSISKTDHPDRPWYLEYSDGFDEFRDGKTYPTFEEACDAVAEAINRRCITCDRGAVEDRPWGWECTACGSSDVAVGCTR